MTPMETKAGTPNSRNLAIPLLLASVALALFSFNLDFPRTVNFDEFHYIPSAKQFLSLTENQNYEHPPLAKELIAIGVGLVGDNPVGWRIMSMVFGVLTLLGMHRLALVLFESPLLAACAAILTLFNQLLYVQSRIAMLDTFMMAFLAWGWALGLEGWRALDHSPKGAGACWGLAARAWDLPQPASGLPSSRGPRCSRLRPGAASWSPAAGRRQAGLPGASCSSPSQPTM